MSCSYSFHCVGFSCFFMVPRLLPQPWETERGASVAWDLAKNTYRSVSHDVFLVWVKKSPIFSHVMYDHCRIFFTIFSLKQQRLKNTGKSCRLFLDLKTRASHVLEVCRAMFENRATLQGSRKSCLDLGSLIFLTGGGKVWSIVLTRWLAWIIFVVFFFRRGPTWIMPCF